MKKILLLATAFVFTLAVMAQPKAEDVAKFTVEKYDFGKIKQGVPVTYHFEIKNISNKPIVVENSWASCGCTTPEKIVDPIMPGATAKLKVDYNAAALNAFHKDVFVKFAGVDQPKSLQISGEVLTPDAYEVYLKEKANKPKTPSGN